YAMKELLLSISFLLLLLSPKAQSIQTFELNGVNDFKDQVPATIIGDELWCTIKEERDYFSDLDQKAIIDFRIQVNPRQFSWNDFTSRKQVPFANEEVFSISYAPLDSTAVLSCFNPKSNKHELYSSKRRGELWGELNKIQTLGDEFACLHPFLSEAGDQLYFSAKADTGSWDIYFSNLVDGEWQEAQKVSGAVNTTKDEFYPVLRDGNLYISSNNTSNGDFDVFLADKRQQWRVLRPLNPPINSSANDLNIVFLSDARFFVGSDRAGNYDVYSFEEQVEEPVLLKYTALLEVKGVPVPFSEVEVFNELNERVVLDVTKEDGTFDLFNLRLRRSYKVRFNQLSERELEHAALYILNEKGDRIMVLRPGLDGFFLFEVLPFDEMEQLAFLENIDESQLLTVKIEGTLNTEDDVPSEKGLPIYIIDENGELLEIAYTREGGKFKFDELTPSSSYRFRLDEKEKRFTMVVMDGDKEVEIPIEAGEGFYERVKDTEALRLVNEKGEPIVIRTSERFIFQSIYFDFDQFELTAQAKEQLDLLVAILLRNPKLNINLSSHTDSRGTTEYNLNLSKKRAVSTLNYLLAKGINNERISAVGRGESELLNECADELECTEDAHAVNRRTEIVFAVPN
ncbi:MAG: OmpA family protein, partial [Flavobacteriales bacterium]|nr:OmpA family protein [Flavobacteriales bacterium]